jgi:hypothetical protein
MATDFAGMYFPAAVKGLSVKELFRSSETKASRRAT